jgi:hypothetical protein
MIKWRVKCYWMRQIAWFDWERLISNLDWGWGNLHCV